jgi:hypothetical protein
MINIKLINGSFASEILNRSSKVDFLLSFPFLIPSTIIAIPNKPNKLSIILGKSEDPSGISKDSSKNIIETIIIPIPI